MTCYLEKGVGRVKSNVVGDWTESDASISRVCILPRPRSQSPGQTARNNRPLHATTGPAQRATLTAAGQTVRVIMLNYNADVHKVRPMMDCCHCRKLGILLQKQVSRELLVFHVSFLKETEDSHTADR